MKQLYTFLFISLTFSVLGQNLTTVYVDMSEYTGTFDKVQIQVEQEGWGWRDTTQDVNDSNIWFATISSSGDAASPAKVQYKWAAVNGATVTAEDLGANCYGGNVDNDFIWDYNLLADANTAGEDAFNTNWWEYFNRVIVTDGSTAQSSNTFHFGTMRSNSVATTTITLTATQGNKYYINYDKGSGDWDQYADVLAVDNLNGTHTATVRASVGFEYVWATGAGNEIGVSASLELDDMSAPCGTNRIHTAGSTGDDTWAICPATASIDDLNLSFSVYPNPVNNTLNISAGSTIDAVNIFDLTGREVLRATPNVEKTSLDVSSLNKGFYLLTVKSGNQELTTKLVK